MTSEKAGGYISQLKFNNGETLDISANDIVVFVGPNNAGKSQSLKDIYAFREKSSNCCCIRDINRKISKIFIHCVVRGIPR